MHIDLGEVRSVGEARAGGPAGPPEPAQRPKWMKLSAVLALVPALVLSAAASRPEPALTVLADLDIGTTMDIVGVVEDTVAVRRLERVIVYGFDGRERWSRPAPGRAATYLRSGKVIVQTFEENPYTTAYSAVDGRQLWSYPGSATEQLGVITVFSRKEGLSIHDEAGRLLWALADVSVHAFAPDTRTVFALDRKGELSERRLETGAVIHSQPFRPIDEVASWIAVTPEVVGINERGSRDSDGKATLFDRRTLQARGERREFVTDRRPLRYGCGPVDCELTRGDDEVSVRDKETGAVLWRTTRGRGLLYTPAGLLDYPLYEGESLIQRMTLADPRTGNKVGDTGGWQRIPLREGRTSIAPVLVRIVFQEDSSERSYLAAFTERGVITLGSVPRALFRCAFDEWRLACVTVDRHLMIVRINRGRF